jgi:hypothetical protein
MAGVWEPIPGTKFFSRNGEGVYERLTDQLYMRVDEVEETDGREVTTRFAEAFENAHERKIAVTAGESSHVRVRTRPQEVEEKTTLDADLDIVNTALGSALDGLINRLGKAENVLEKQISLLRRARGRGMN